MKTQTGHHLGPVQEVNLEKFAPILLKIRDYGA